MSGAAIQSMTGYGRAAQRTPAGQVIVELRSTNHRFLEVEQRLPNGFTALQNQLAEIIRGGVQRGRVDAFVTTHQTNGDQRRVVWDERLLARYYAALTDLKARFGLKGPVTLEHLLALPHAVTITEERVPVERIQEPIRQAMQAAVAELVRVRRREGAKLAADIRRQLQTIARHARAVRLRMPKALEQQRQRLRERLEELLGAKSGGMASQLEQAVALLKEADIHEERIRLESHIAHVREALASSGPVGKRLDFIAQELMREANTMGAKVNDPEAARHVVQIKGCIEKIREQVQNLE